MKFEWKKKKEMGSKKVNPENQKSHKSDMAYKGSIQKVKSIRIFIKVGGEEEIGNMCHNRSPTSNKIQIQLEEGQGRFL